MARKNSKSRSSEDKMIKRNAKDMVELMEQVRELAKEELFYLSQGIIREGGVVQKLIDEGDETVTSTVEQFKKQFHLQREVAPLAGMGLFRYDRSEQFDDGDQSPFSEEVQMSAAWQLRGDDEPDWKRKGRRA